MARGSQNSANIGSHKSLRSDSSNMNMVSQKSSKILNNKQSVLSPRGTSTNATPNGNFK